MPYEVQEVEMKEEFKICPACGYQDGFHSMFKKEGDATKWNKYEFTEVQVEDLGNLTTAPGPEMFDAETLGSELHTDNNAAADNETLLISHFFSIIAILVSNSGGCISATSPHSKRL